MVPDLLALTYASNLEAIRQQWSKQDQEGRLFRAQFDAAIRRADQHSVITLGAGDYRIDEAPGPLTDPGALLESSKDL